MPDAILVLIVPFLLACLLLGGAAFVWRHWRDRPWPAALVAGAVVATIPALLRSKPIALLVLVLLVLALSSLAARRMRKR